MCRLTLAVRVRFVEVEEFNQTDRGPGGFGSTGLH
jgi:dUTPase